MKRWTLFLMLICSLMMGSVAFAADDILIEDFEGKDYGDWKVEGEAFGPGPAKGTLPNQMEVSGFKGERLVNTFYKGDGTTGTLISPEFTVKRDYINFLVGGGGYKGKTCINLMIDGEVVRTATGPNTSPGGSEQLDWHSWDVSKLQGKQARIQIVDQRTGGWGHINVDHIVQSDSRKGVLPSELQRTIRIEHKYLNLPVHDGEPKRTVQFFVDGKEVRRFHIKLAHKEPQFWVFSDVSDFKGEELTVKTDGLKSGSMCLEALTNSDGIKGAENLYDEKYRPQFHFSSRRGWNNDPNGMVYYDGEWHLFYQHNPFGIHWGNMHWGHAVSPDLVHWEELGNELYPWTMAEGHCFSGGALIDRKNTAGFKTGDEDVMVAAFTDTAVGEAIAYSNDRGRTFTYYEGNPVVKHKGRDPKVIWYEPDDRWVMAVYDIRNDSKGIAFYTSKDLKEWEYQSRIEGYFECPEIFELPVDGDPDNTKWVIYAADARYAVGDFDGEEFTPDHEGKHRVHYGRYYASQTFNNAPEGRRIQIGWGKIGMPGMPFNQMMTFPCRLTLRTTEEGVRMFAKPVRELSKLHEAHHGRENVTLKEKSTLDIPVSGRLFEIRAEFEVSEADFGVQIGDKKVTYDAENQRLVDMPLEPVDGKIRMQILVDRPSIEVCGNNGRVYLTDEFHHGDIDTIKAFAGDKSVKLNSLDVYELESTW